MSRAARLAASARTATPGRPTPSVARAVRAVAAPLARLLWRPRVEGLAHLPTSGPYVLVANHGAAMGLAEVLSLASLWIDLDRPLAGFAHPFAFHVWPASWFIPGLGCVPSSHEAGDRALADGVPLLVMPGGDHECALPFWRSRAVDFTGRDGFARLAARNGAPFVPMGIVGARATAPVLFAARGVARELLVVPRLLGVKRWPITVLGVAGAIALLAALPLPWSIVAAWAWLSSPLQMLPWVPATLVFRVGPPLPSTTAARDVEAAVRALVQSANVATSGP